MNLQTLAVVPDMLEAFRRFVHARDHYAEHGAYPPEYEIVTYDDWVADIAATILDRVKS